MSLFLNSRVFLCNTTFISYSVSNWICIEWPAYKMTGLKTPTWTWKITLKGNYSINTSNDIQKQMCLELSPLVELYSNVIHKVLIWIFSLFYSWWYWKKLGPFSMAGQESTHHLSLYSHLGFVISDWTILIVFGFLVMPFGWTISIWVYDKFQYNRFTNVWSSKLYTMLKEHFSNLIFFSW